MGHDGTPGVLCGIIIAMKKIITKNREAGILKDLMSRYPGRYSARLGIDIDGREPEDLFRWLLAAILYGGHISSFIAERTYGEFIKSGMDSPQAALDAGWDKLVAALDAGGYTRYDFKTADKLMEVCGNLVREYGGDLNRLHDESDGPVDLEDRLLRLGKGVGAVTVNIFLRELREVWKFARPGLSRHALEAARGLGLVGDDDDPPIALLRIWGKGMPGRDFRDFEAALVSHGLAMRRKKVA